MTGGGGVHNNSEKCKREMGETVEQYILKFDRFYNRGTNERSCVYRNDKSFLTVQVLLLVLPVYFTRTDEETLLGA